MSHTNYQSVSKSISDLVSITGEILNGKVHFLCNVEKIHKPLLRKTHYVLEIMPEYGKICSDGTRILAYFMQ